MQHVVPYDSSVVTGMPAWREVQLLVSRELGEALHLDRQSGWLPTLGIKWKVPLGSRRNR